MPRVFLQPLGYDHIPFKGAAEVHGAVAGRQIKVAAMNVGEALQYAKDGTPLRNLGQMSTARTTLAPDLAPFEEQGFANVLASLRGLAAPKAASYFAPLRYLPPADHEAEHRDAEAGFRKMWQEIPWGKK